MCRASLTARRWVGQALSAPSCCALQQRRHRVRVSHHVEHMRRDGIAGCECRAQPRTIGVAARLEERAQRIDGLARRLAGVVGCRPLARHRRTLSATLEATRDGADVSAR